MPHGTLDPAALPRASPTGLSPSPAGLPRAVPLPSAVACAVRTPARTRAGLGSSGSARRYSRNHMPSLRTAFVFSSSGYLDVSVRRVPSSMPMCSAWGGGVFPRRVSPFRHLRIAGHLLLPAAFRSLSRLSSAPGAKASALCPSSLNRGTPCAVPLSRLAWRYRRVHPRHRCLASLDFRPAHAPACMAAPPPGGLPSGSSFWMYCCAFPGTDGHPCPSKVLVSSYISVFGFQGAIMLMGQNLSSFAIEPTSTMLFRNRFRLMGLSGLEPPTSRLSGVRSNQLSYKPTMEMEGIEPLTPCLQGRCSPS